MKNKPFFLFLFTLLVPFAPLAAQDLLHKTDSTVIEAKVTEIGETEIRYKKFSNPDGPTYAIKKSEVAYVVYQNGERETYTVAKPVAVSPPYDTLAYLEKIFGVQLQEVTVPDTGCKIVALEKSGIIKAPGLKPPLNDIIQYVGTTSSKEEIRAKGKRIRTKDDFTRAVVGYKQQGVTTIYFLIRFNKHVDHVYTADISSLSLTQQEIVQKQKTDSVAAKLKLPCSYKKSRFTLGGGIALRNGYAIGDLNSWFMELNQTPDAGVTDGTSSFYYAWAGAFFPLSKKRARPVCLGTTLTMYFPHSNPLAWPIQGRVITYASSSPVNYIRLKPLMAGLSLPVRFPFTDHSAVVIAPTLLYAKLSGYSYGSQQYTDDRDYGSGSTGLGMSMQLGLEIFFGKQKLIGATADFGFRSLKTALSYSNNGGPYQPATFQDGREVKVDLSGPYVLIGAAFRTK